MKKHPLDEFVGLLVDLAQEKAKTAWLDKICYEPPFTPDFQRISRTKPPSTTKSEGAAKSRKNKDF